jgi:hypothetical protein
VKDQPTHTPTKAKDEPTKTPDLYEPGSQTAGMIEALKVSVLELPMRSGDRQSLYWKLAYAHTLAVDGQLCAVTSQLTNFVTRVYELTNSNRLSYDVAATLLEQAGAIVQYLREENVCAKKGTW